MFLVGCGKDGVNGNNGMNTSSIRAIPIYKLSGSSELTEAVIEAVFEEDVEDVSLLYKQKQINNKDLSFVFLIDNSLYYESQLVGVDSRNNCTKDFLCQRSAYFVVDESFNSTASGNRVNMECSIGIYDDIVKCELY
jgi:hypothetical protein